MTQNNQIQISNKFKQLRIDRVNSWTPRLDENNYDFLFPIEREFLARVSSHLTANSIKIFTPLKYPYELDKDYHTYISYFIECLDVMPLKMDLSFDFSWKGLEFYMGKAFEKHKGASSSNVSDLIKYSRTNYWFDIITINPSIQNCLESFIKLMPSQSYEYLGKRMFDNYSVTEPKNNPLYTRIAMTNGNIDIKIKNLLADIYLKFGAPSNGDKSRKIGRLIHKLLSGESISLPDNSDSSKTLTYTFELKEKLDLIVNGLLYTYRNERFHGNTFSPFKSSKASLKTYSHAHYLFLWTYFLVNITKLYLNNISISHIDIEENLATNINSFERLYGRHLEK